MKKVFEYLFYFFYSFNIGKIDDKNWEKVLSAVMAMAIIQLLNILVLIVLPTFFGLDTYSFLRNLFEQSKYNILFIFFVLIIANYLYFWYGKRYEKITGRYYNTSKKKRNMIKMVGISYCLISVLIFFIIIFSVSTLP